MVAKISFGSSLYGALAYNGEKIEKDEGKVLGANKVFFNPDGTFSIHSSLNDFMLHMPNHTKVRKPIVHISLNPHPDDKLSDAQMTAIATEYIERMGYGNQPYMIYKHEDIDRHHIHIVTLGVDTQGRKISDSNNFFASKKITRELEQRYGLLPAEKQKRREVFRNKKVDAVAGDVKKQIASIVKPLANSYRCLSFNEYRALLSLYNICVEEVKGEVRGNPYNGLVYFATDDKGEKAGNPFKSSLFGKSVGYEALQKRFADSSEFLKDKKLPRQTQHRALDALRHCTDKTTFQAELHKRGMDVVLRENDSGRIYGVTFIDHNNGCVLNGSRLGKELSANAITEWFNNPQPIQQQQTSSPVSEHTEYSDTVLSRTEDDGAALGGLLDLPDNPTIDPEEERFRRRMQKRKRRKM